MIPSGLQQILLQLEAAEVLCMDAAAEQVPHAACLDRSRKDSHGSVVHSFNGGQVPYRRQTYQRVWVGPHRLQGTYQLFGLFGGGE